MSANALASLHDAERQGKREQTVLTPPCITDRLVREWGHIAMDPCAEAKPGAVPATVHLTVEDDGLSQAWLPRSYCNPRFDRLKLWLAHAAKQPGPVALLCPVRSHRRWYREAVASCARSGGAVIDLDPIAFVGFTATFPAPLALLCWGWIPNAALWREIGGVRLSHYLEVA